MKYLLGWLFGVILGAGVALGLLYVNPLTMNAAAPDALAAPSMRYALDGPHLLASTHNALLPLPRLPDRVPLLWESGVRGSWLQALVLEDDEVAQAGALATRLSVPSERSNALTAGLVTDDSWLITLPGRGIVYAHGSSNVWPLLKDTILRVDLLGREWPGVRRYAALAGPDGATAPVLGLTGEYAGLTGTLSEILEIDDYATTGLAGLTAEVALDMAHPDSTKVARSEVTE